MHWPKSSLNFIPPWDHPTFQQYKHQWHLGFQSWKPWQQARLQYPYQCSLETPVVKNTPMISTNTQNGYKCISFGKLHYLAFKPLTSIRFLSTVSLLRVRVPVLSLHRTSIPAISSMAVILFVIAPCSDRRWDPIAMVTDKTVGIAIGIPPIRSTSMLSIPSLYFLCWIGYITTISISMPIAIEQIQKLPMAVNTWSNYQQPSKHQSNKKKKIPEEIYMDC